MEPIDSGRKRVPPGSDLGAGFALVMGGFLLLMGEISNTDDLSYSTPAGLRILAGFVLLAWAGMAAGLVGSIKTEQATLAKLGAEADVYEERRRRRGRDLSTTDDDGWEPYKSKRQMQHEWYGPGNSDLNWRARELGEALGIPDGDTYKSNWE